MMWASSLSHNDLTGCGTKRDFATHRLEHELSGMFDVAHAAGLSALWGSWARYVMNVNVSRFVRFAVNVMGVENYYKIPKKRLSKALRLWNVFITILICLQISANFWVKNLPMLKSTNLPKNAAVATP